jgi:cell division protein FtsZ
MQDEVKVTVVATGLNRAVARQSVRGNEREAQRAPISLVRNATTGQPEFSAMDEMPTARPSFGNSLRGSAGSRSVESSSAPAVADFGSDSSYLDIPAFLRRQAD